MDLSPIVAHLKVQLTGLRAVGASAELELAQAGGVAMPAAFVLPLAEAASDMGLLTSTAQKVQVSFGVVHCLANRRDPQGGAALGDLHAMRMALRTALVGWVPDVSNGEAVSFTSGRLLQMDGDGRLWWMDEFELTTYYWSS
jgi:hypothetical protein